jgi:gluconate 2-dehydrogenase gamma chain
MTVSRRHFLTAGTAGALVPAAAEAAPAPQPGAAASSTASAPGAEAYQFFNADEARFIEAALQRLIPPDAVGPSAREAGVPGYIDRQLAGAWGAGERLYRSGPWAAGAPTQGYQLPFTPAELFRTALRAIRQQLGEPRFESRSGEQQDTYLTQLQTGTRDLGGVPANVFFESLWGMAVEGYFCDPVYGGNRGMASWRMLGFPGAHGAFYELVDRHGAAFEAAPRSLAQTGAGQVHVMPDIPATAPAPAHPAHR